jgi:hypothetical protein
MPEVVQVNIVVGDILKEDGTVDDTKVGLSTTTVVAYTLDEAAQMGVEFIKQASTKTKA